MSAEIIASTLPTHATDFICADCEEPLRYTDEVFLVQVVQMQRYQDRLLFHDIIDDQDPDGPCFRFEPYHFCFKCWEDTYNQVRDETEDEPPVIDGYDLAADCVCCGSSIRNGEFAGTFTLGEFHLSDRAPNGVRGQSFKPLGKSDIMCLYCLATMNENYITMWPDLSQYDECIDCIQTRCWRGSACDCRCHHEPPAEEPNEST
jgi:hypothetical protein